jgi:hypothetical protein
VARAARRSRLRLWQRLGATTTSGGDYCRRAMAATSSNSGGSCER